MNELVTAMLLLCLTGCVSGTLAGLFGIGGGAIMVPAMLIVLPDIGIEERVALHVALGTSLAAIIFAGASSTLSHHRRGAVLWPAVKGLVPGLVIGSLVGGAVAGWIPRVGLQWFFGLFLLLVALKLFTGFRPRPGASLPGATGLFAAGSGIGVLSAWAGIGGGSLTGPFLIWRQVDPRNAVASAAACGLPIAFAGTAGFAFSGWSEPSLPPFSTGYVYWPAVLALSVTSALFAPLGARIAHSVPRQALQRAFAVLLAAVAVGVLLDA